MSIPGSLACSIYVDWFNAHGTSSSLARIGPIMLICLNLPPNKRLKPENAYVAGIIPGPKEQTALQFNYLLMPLIKELKEMWQGYHFSPTSTGPSESFICVAIVDVFAMHKPTVFISCSGNYFCNFFTIHKAQIEEIVPNLATHTQTKLIKQLLKNGFGKPQNNKEFSLCMECNINFWKTFHIGMRPEWLIFK
ncbi:hypothetical protein O181_029172 [Austropuccinia psidii MF-1]|uniref:Uncharacterized protein n=1 Tax=Austropuccinia psidii MF-1 TaxID=1389203 RepID=A0A9Q3CTB3_9BASI|nr:hypothetical protein [Austropuccinia psidii MF-1]